MGFVSSTVANVTLAMPASARRFDPQTIARAELSGRLAGQVRTVEEVDAARTVGASVSAARRVAPPLGDQREPHRRQRLDLADEPVAAAPPAAAAAAAAQRELAHA